MAAARGNIDMIDPNGFKKIDKYTMTVKLKRPWSDMFSAFGQRYLSIIKNGAQPPFTVQNFIGTGAVSDLLHDDRDGDAHPANAGSPPHDLRIESNAIKHWHNPIVASFKLAPR